MRTPARFAQTLASTGTVVAGLAIWGGVPIIYQNECVGAIGVSGVQSQDDEKIASAGVAALE